MDFVAQQVRSFVRPEGASSPAAPSRLLGFTPDPTRPFVVVVNRNNSQPSPDHLASLVQVTGGTKGN